MLTALALGLYIAVLLAAGARDLTHYEIPNRLTAALLAGFVLMIPSLPLTAIVNHLSAGLLVLAGAALLFVAGIWGGGDAKLMAATAVWIGWGDLAAFLLLTALLGAILALGLLVLRRLAAGRASAGRWYRRLLSPGEGVPYGVAIAAAALMLVPRLPFNAAAAG